MSRVLTEMGLSIRIEAGHHPSSSLVHPADKAERFKPQTVKRENGLLCFCGVHILSRLWPKKKKVNLILMRVFADTVWSKSHSSLCNTSCREALFVPRSTLISTKPPTSSAAASPLGKGRGKFLSSSPSSSSSFYSSRLNPPVSSH